MLRINFIILIVLLSACTKICEEMPIRKPPLKYGVPNYLYYKAVEYGDQIKCYAGSIKDTLDMISWASAPELGTDINMFKEQVIDKLAIAIAVNVYFNNAQEKYLSYDERTATLTKEKAQSIYTSLDPQLFGNLKFYITHPYYELGADGYYQEVQKKFIYNLRDTFFINRLK